ncbi:hypothetical protein DFJ63DRAFT_24230 [Scheffersomyces coipomensis]|uniref:uncharacterized protein n=1 Tax=Scheffersomyces coipomensis TaxID=1788519 RepID=UPI00315C6364
MSVQKKNPVTATRRKHTNSKLGCLNCKRKKIRCNEQLPVCGNCLKGKKETCSYLSLSEPEIDRIKLTHSLRNSQNKLLNQDYRLPTSSSNHKHQTQSHETYENKTDNYDQEHISNKKISLEIKFELSKLPLRFPSISYPPVQFDNLTVNDFSQEFRLLQDSSSDEEARGRKINRNKLPNGVFQPATFKKLEINKVFRKSFANKTKVNNGNDLNFHIFIGKINILDFFNDYLIDMSSAHWPYSEIVCDTFICLGETVILNQFHQSSKYNWRFKRDRSLNFVEEFEKKCFENHGAMLTKLRRGIIQFQDIEGSAKNSQEMGYVSSLLGYSSFFLIFSIIMLKFSAESYLNSSRGIFAVFEIYSKSIVENKLVPSPLYQFLSRNMQYNISSINIPSYDPQFLVELESNLNQLHFIYNHDLRFKDDCNNLALEKIRFQYNNLVEFFKVKLMPIIFKTRNEKYVTTYSPTTIYEILNAWFSIFPTESISYNPQVSQSAYSQDDSKFVNDLTTTLYMYYQGVSASLSAVFPACKYLYGMNYMLPSSTSFYHDRKVMETSKSNPYLQQYFNFPVDGLLQRHNYYTMRVFSFFNRRNIFYQNHLVWSSNPYNEYLRANRFKSRILVDSYEVPIKSFNTTLIRPEHYPTKVDHNNNSNNSNNFNHNNRAISFNGGSDKVSDQSFIKKAVPTPIRTTLGNGNTSKEMANFVFTRRDETMIQKLYTRNIETLNFFDSNSILQFDYQSMLLLRDYRPGEELDANSHNELGIEDIQEYYEDKTIILNSLH